MGAFGLKRVVRETITYELTERMPIVMEASGHQSYQSFSIYLHKTEINEKQACSILERVDHFRGA